jgi:hypothetical protein
MALLYLLIISFPKFDSLTATEVALCVGLGPKCQNYFPSLSQRNRVSLSLRLSGPDSISMS